MTHVNVNDDEWLSNYFAKHIYVQMSHGSCSLFAHLLLYQFVIINMHIKWITEIIVSKSRTLIDIHMENTISQWLDSQEVTQKMVVVTLRTVHNLTQDTVATMWLYQTDYSDEACNW